MTKHQGHNLQQAQTSQTEALQKAQDKLKALGATYPFYDPKKSPEENYDALLAYSQKESSLMREFLNPHPTERPLVINSTKPKREWGNSYYD